MSLAIRRGRQKNIAHRYGMGVGAKIAISFAILLLLLVAVGLVYTWWMGRNAPAQIPDSPVSKPLAKAPSVIADDAPLGVSLQSMTSTVKPGENMAMTLKTNPKAACSIKVEFAPTKFSNDSGLVPKDADEYGIVSWSWKSEPNWLPGIGSATVTCANAKNSGVYVGKFEIKKLDA